MPSLDWGRKKMAATVATAPAHARPHWRNPLDSMVVCVSRGASGAFSLLVKEGRSPFGVMAGIWAKF